MTPQPTGHIVHSDKPTICRVCGTEIPAGKSYRQMYDGEAYLGDQCYGRCTGTAAPPVTGICRYCGIPITFHERKWHHAQRPVQQHRALPLVVEEDRLLILQEELNAMPSEAKYQISFPLLRMVMAKIDAEIGGRPNRLIFLSWAFGRTIRTSKLNKPMMPIEGTPTPEGQRVMDLVEKATGNPAVLMEPAIEDGLEPHEAMALLMWASPARLTVDPTDKTWTYSMKFHADLRKLQIHIGNQMSFLPGEQMTIKGSDE
jgi:hypothetical protein